MTDDALGSIKRAPGRVTWWPLGLLVVVLVALVVLPVSIQRRTRPLWRQITQVGDPARTAVSEIQGALALEMSALRGYLITRERRFLDRYDGALAEERAVMRRLRPLAARLGPSVERRFERLSALADRWHASIAEIPLRAGDPAAAAAAFPLDESLYRATLEAADELEEAIADRVSASQRRLVAIERTNFLATVALVALALVAAGLITWIGRRIQRLARELRVLARDAERHADEAESRRRLAEELMESRARLIRGISHDLKNPLSAVDGYAQLLEAEARGELGETQRRWVERIRRQVASMLAILTDLLELSRAEAGELKIDIAPTDLRGVIHDSVDDHRPEAERAGLVLAVDVPREARVVRTDRVRVRQILGNLLSNAIKYTGAGGRVAVRLEVRRDRRAPRPGRWLCIDVSDTGPGIPETELDKIFDEFYRVKGHEKEGAGIGLAISRRIARHLGGEITVESAPARGSTFTLWLPSKAAAAAPPAEAVRRTA